MTLFTGHRRSLVHLRHSRVIGIDAHDGLVRVVHLQHQPLGLRLTLEENLHQYLNDKLHRREVVVVDGDFIASRLLQPVVRPLAYL